jgi:hypothetical protein
MTQTHVCTGIISLDTSKIQHIAKMDATPLAVGNNAICPSYTLNSLDGTHFFSPVSGTLGHF